MQHTKPARPDYRPRLRDEWEQIHRETEAERRGDRSPAMLPLPITFTPETLYPLPQIEKHLSGTMTLKTFLERLNLDRTGKRIFQYAIFGHEILTAMRSMAEADAAPEPAAEEHFTPRLPRKPGRPRKQPPVAPVVNLAVRKVRQ